jgi:glutamate/aspartate transport system ATP-binding protein
MDKGVIVEDCVKDEFFTNARSDRARDFLAKIITH